MLKLEDKRIILRIGSIKDIPSIIDYFRRNEKHLKPYEPNKPIDFYTREYWRKRVILNQIEYQHLRELRVFIFEKENPLEVIGTLDFTNIIFMPFYSCYMGYGLDKNKQNRGYMNEAATLGINFIFEKLNLHKISATYMPHNIKSKKVLERLNFKVEGYLKENALINGIWEDHILAGLINHKYR